MTDVTDCETLDIQCRVYKAKLTKVATVVVYMYTLHMFCKPPQLERQGISNVVNVSKYISSDVTVFMFIPGVLMIDIQC